MTEPTIKSTIEAMTRLRRKYAISIVATNNALCDDRLSSQAQWFAASKRLAEAITSAEGLIKTGHATQAYQLICRFI